MVRQDRKGWRIRTFNALTDGVAVECDNQKDIRTDVLFQNIAAHKAYETFIDICSDEGQTKSTNGIEWAHAGITCVMEDISRRLKLVGSRGKEQHVMNTAYNALLPVATTNPQAECLTSLRRALLTEAVMILQLDCELQVNDGSTPEYMNSTRKG